MTTKEAIRGLIASYAEKQEWVKLDALNQWATCIDARYNIDTIGENLAARYPEVKAFPQRSTEILNELTTKLKELGIEYRSSRLEGEENKEAGELIQGEIYTQCRQHFLEDIKNRIQRASENERKLLYLSGKVLQREKTTYDFSPEAWNGLFEATFGPLLSGKAIDILRWFGVCNYEAVYRKKGAAYYYYHVPQYEAAILDDIESLVGTPEITDIEMYMKTLASERDFPRLAFLEILLGHLESSYMTSIWRIKEAFELLYPLSFDKHAYSKPGVLAKLKYEFYICPLNREKMLHALLEAKRELLKPLCDLFQRVAAEIKQGSPLAQAELAFQDSMAAYAGFIDAATSRMPLYVLITPWIAPPQSRHPEDYLQQLPWIKSHQPCLIMTIDQLRPSLIRPLQSEGTKDICLMSLMDGDKFDMYCLGASAKPFSKIIASLSNLHYQVDDLTKSLREEWFPLTTEALVEFGLRMFSHEELYEMWKERSGTTWPSGSSRTKELMLQGIIERDGVVEWAKRVGSPSFYDTKIASTKGKEPLPPVGPMPSPPIVVTPELEIEPITPPILPRENHIIIGGKEEPRQWGIIGTSGDRRVVIDLNAPHIVFVTGTMGAGKGYTIGVMSEMLVTESIPQISQMAKRSTIIVLYSPRDDVPSEFWSIREPNDNQIEVNKLQRYDAMPRKLLDESQFKVFIDPGAFSKYKDVFEKEYRTNNVMPLHMDPSTLIGEDWANALATGGSSDALYIKKIFKLLRGQPPNFTLEDIIKGINDSDLNEGQKGFAKARLEILEEYLQKDDFMNKLAIGGVNILDFRKSMYMPDDIFTIMTLIMSRLQNRKELEGEPFVFIMNEAHLYFKKGISGEFVSTIDNLIRRKRHGANWLLLDTHLPGDVDSKVIELSDIKVLHFSDKTVDSSALKKILEGTQDRLYELNIGEAIICANLSSEGLSKPLRVQIRPRITKHGGATKTAI